MSALQGKARCQPRTAPGRIKAANHADSDGDGYGVDHEPGAQIRLQKIVNGWQSLYHLHAESADQHAHYAAEKAEQRRLAQDHAHYSATLPANGEQDANLLRALEHGHEHGVHDAKHPDNHRQQRCAPAHGADEAIGLAIAKVLARHHGAGFRDEPVDLLAETLHLVLSHRGSGADVNDVDLALIPRDFLKQRQRKNYRAIL